MPAVAELFDTIPSPASHVFWYAWREQELPDAAISVQGSLYLAAFGGWTDPAQDAAMLAWPAEQMRRLEPLSRGIQLADENLVARPARFLSDENGERLEALRARHDPDGRVPQLPDRGGLTMGKRVLGVGAGTSGGSAEILLKAALMEAEAAGAEVALLRLDDVRIGTAGPLFGNT